MVTIANPRRVLLGALVAVLLLSTPTQAHPQTPPRPGDVQRLVVITLSLQVGSTEKDARQVTYSPPPGWYVRSHRVDVTRRLGNSSYSVSTVPQNWAWMSEDKVTEAYKSLIELAAQTGQQGLQAKFAQEREQTLLEIRRVRANHHALVLDAVARGEGFLRSSGGLDLTVTAELVFLGTEETIECLIAGHRAKLGK